MSTTSTTASSRSMVASTVRTHSPRTEPYHRRRVLTPPIDMSLNTRRTESAGLDPTGESIAEAAARLRSVTERLERQDGSSHLDRTTGSERRWDSLEEVFRNRGYVNELGYPQPYVPPSAFRPHQSSSSDFEATISRVAGPASQELERSASPPTPPAAPLTSIRVVPVSTSIERPSRFRERARDFMPVSDLRGPRNPTPTPSDPNESTVPPPQSASLTGQLNFYHHLIRRAALQSENPVPSHSVDWVGGSTLLGHRPGNENILSDMLDPPDDSPTYGYNRYRSRPADRSTGGNTQLYGEIPIDSVNPNTRSRMTDPLHLGFRAQPSVFGPMPVSHPISRSGIPLGGDFGYQHYNHFYPHPDHLRASEGLAMRSMRLPSTFSGYADSSSALELRDDMDKNERKAIIEMVVKGMPRLPPGTRQKAAESMVVISTWSEVEVERDDFCSVCHEEYKPETGVAVTPCRHMYHKECLSTWLNTPFTSSCPMCRRDLAVLACLTRMVPSRKKDDALPYWMDASVSFSSNTTSNI